MDRSIQEGGRRNRDARCMHGWGKAAWVGACVQRGAAMAGGWRVRVLTGRGRGGGGEERSLSEMRSRSDLFLVDPISRGGRRVRVREGQAINMAIN